MASRDVIQGLLHYGNASLENNAVENLKGFLNNYHMTYRAYDGLEGPWDQMVRSEFKKFKTTHPGTRVGEWLIEAGLNIVIDVAPAYPVGKPARVIHAHPLDLPHRAVESQDGNVVKVRFGST